MKKIPTEIKENLQFLCVEIDAQLATLSSYYRNPSASLARKVRDRAGYAYNLKTRIHTATVNRIAAGVEHDSDKFCLRCIEFIATDIERIAEICRHCITQSEQIDDVQALMSKAFIAIVKKVRQAIKLILPAVIERKSSIALDIEQINQGLRSSHQRLIKRYVSALKKQTQTKQLTQALFVAYEMKQFDDALLRISETIVSANVGQPINFERYYSFQSLISDVEKGDSDVTITPIAETRSGTAISGLSNDAEKTGFMAVYKDGQKQKLKEEKQGLNSWDSIYPGLAPKILSYQKRGESAALLIEHLPGYTLEKVIVNESEKLQKQALKALKKTLESLWTETLRKKVSPALFMQQMESRLADVYKIHPEFDAANSHIGDYDCPSMKSLIKQARQLEKQYPPPFSVYIHGDFNVDNIIFDPIENRINFIDLHRSKYTDYVQDVTIFMVSNYRLQILDSERRKQIMKMAIEMYRFARRFAKQHQDNTFEIRLALGLARAFASSTRFILDKALAKRMFYRARYLIELVLKTHPKQIHRFSVPVKEIFVE
nr:phosphotransferase [uncultured Methylophaga sp.]